MEKSTVLLECKSVSKKYEKFELTDISFSLEAGYIMGIIGRNGCGKSTLIKALLGSCKFTGDSYIDGVSMQKEPVSYKKSTGYVLAENPFPGYWNAVDCGKIYGGRYETFSMDSYLKWLETFQIPAKAAIKKLSKGQQIKQQLAFALSYDAKVYIMDEPNANLDAEFREEFYGILRDLVADGKRSIIYVSHLVEEMECFADYLLWLKEGKTEYFGTAEELLSSYVVAECSEEEIKNSGWNAEIVGKKANDNHQELLVRCRMEKVPKVMRETCRCGDLKEIMYYVEKGGM